jgi:hypothetical protein
MATSRGIRNNNPLNIRNNTDVFQGEVKPGTDKSFKQFYLPEFGYRAAFVTLATYLTKYSRNTIEKIVSAWAPPSENNTEGYIKHVEQYSGIARSKVLTDQSGDDYIKIVAAMSRIENGIPAVMDDIISGFNLQNKLKN